MCCYCKSHVVRIESLTGIATVTKGRFLANGHIFCLNAMKPFHLKMLLLTDIVYTPKDTHMYKYQNEGLTGCFNPSHRNVFIITLRSDEVALVSSRENKPLVFKPSFMTPHNSFPKQCFKRIQERTGGLTSQADGFYVPLLLD